MSALVIAGLLWLAYIIFLDQREFNKFTKEAREQEYIDKVIRDFDKEKEQQEFTKPVELHDYHGKSASYYPLIRTYQA